MRVAEPDLRAQPPYGRLDPIAQIDEGPYVTRA